MSGIDEELENELDIFNEDEVIKEEVIKEKAADTIDLFDDIIAKPTDEPSSIVGELLKSKGITDAKITLLDENNVGKQVDFYELSKEEQLEVLNAQEEILPISDTEFKEGEKELIDLLREQNISLEEYLVKYKEEIVSEVSGNVEPSYDIDLYDDSELFLLDLKSKYDLTDEELVTELEKELKNEELFNKKIKKVREEYKELEDTYKKNEVERIQTDEAEQYDSFVETMVDTAVNNPEFHGIELDDDEKNEVLSYLLEKDENGTSEFYKSLNTPEKLYEAAWFLKYGKEAFEAITNAYELEIKKLKEDKPKEKPKVVIKKDEKNE